MDERMDAPHIVEYYGPINEQTGRANPHLAKIAGRLVYEGAKSRNKRLYTGVASWLMKANEEIQAGHALPIKTHHEAGDDTLRVAGKFARFAPDGHYEGLIANTPEGQTLATLVDGGYVAAVSLEASKANVLPLESGSAPNKEAGWVEVQGLRLKGAACTNDPGIIEATIRLAESAGDDSLLEVFEVTQGSEEMYWESMSAALRKKRVADGDAMADGKFPIANQSELDAAVHLIGNSTEPADSIKAHIRKQAKKYGLKLPDSWTSGKESAEAGATLTEQQETDMSKATDRFSEALTEAVSDPEKKKADLLEELTGKPAETAPTPVEPKTESAPTEEPVVEATEADELIEAIANAKPMVEAGAAISAASKGKLKAAHDVIAGLGGMPCAPDINNGSDNNGESATGASLTESQAGLVESAVNAALTEAEKRFDERLVALHETYETTVATEAKRMLTEVLKARRKSSAPTESAEEAGAEPVLDRKEALRMRLIQTGHIQG
jgi:hypothetical protein